MFLIKRFNTNAASSLLQAAIKESSLASKAPKIPVFTTGNLKYSPQKLNHLARLIRGMSVDEAMQQMYLVRKKHGISIYHLLKRVGHVLKNNYKKDIKDYCIKQAWVGKGVYLKRISMHGRGRSGIKTRPSCHLKVELGLKSSSTPENVELMKLVKQFKKHRLFKTIDDTRNVYPEYPIWSRKNKKYLNNEKWIEPSNALVTEKNRIFFK